MENTKNEYFNMEKIMSEINPHLIPDTDENLKTEKGYLPRHYNVVWEIISKIIKEVVEKFNFDIRCYKRSIDELNYELKIFHDDCGTCGSKLAEIRGKYPKEPKRKVCPTCLMEKIEYALECNTQSCEAKNII